MSIHTPSPMEAPDGVSSVSADAPDAALRALAREVDDRAAGRSYELAHFAAWVRTRLDVLAEQLTPTHRSRPGVAKQSRRIDPSLN